MAEEFVGNREWIEPVHLTLPGAEGQVQVTGIHRWTTEEILNNLDEGGRFVIFLYSVGLVFVSFKNSSAIHFIPAGSPWLRYAVPYMLINLLLGWWGFRAFFWNLDSIEANFNGGADVTVVTVLGIIHAPLNEPADAGETPNAGQSALKNTPQTLIQPVVQRSVMIGPSSLRTPR